MIGLIVARSKIMLLVEMVRFLGKSKVSKNFLRNLQLEIL